MTCFHALNYSMWELARGYRERQMAAVVAGRWITGRRQRDAVGAREGSEVIVKRMVLFDNDDNLFNRIIWLHGSTYHLPHAVRAEVETEADQMRSTTR